LGEFGKCKTEALDNKGGGVLVYVSTDLSAIEWAPCTQFPEQIWCQINVGAKEKLLVGVCYNSSNISLFPNNDELLRQMITEVSNRHILLMGDFNYQGINWRSFQATDEAAQKFLNFIEDCLTQHVFEATRENSVLDLVITDEPDMTDNVNIYGQFSTSDHNVLHWKTNVLVTKENTQRLSRDYNKMNIEAVKQGLRDFN